MINSSMFRKIIPQSYGYIKIHDYMRERIPKPNKCPICQEIKKLELTNLNHAYDETDKGAWVWKCHGCHRKYDFKEGLILNKTRKVTP